MKIWNSDMLKVVQRASALLIKAACHTNLPTTSHQGWLSVIIQQLLISDLAAEGDRQVYLENE